MRFTPRNETGTTLKLVFAASLVEQTRWQPTGHLDSARQTKPSAGRARLSSVRR